MPFEEYCFIVLAGLFKPWRKSLPRFKRVLTKKAPAPGYYSQAVIAPKDHDIVFLAGQTGNIPGIEGEPVVEGGVGPQTTQALKNIAAVIEAAGGTIFNIVKITVYLKDSQLPYGNLRENARKQSREEFALAYKEYFQHYLDAGVMCLPARTLIWVSEIPLEYPTENTLVELTAIAAIR